MHINIRLTSAGELLEALTRPIGGSGAGQPSPRPSTRGQGLQQEPRLCQLGSVVNIAARIERRQILDGGRRVPPSLERSHTDSNDMTAAARSRFTAAAW
jgi:hypothetical protein